MEGRETSGGVGGALGEVLAPREARRRAPGKKELVLAMREGVSREFTPRPRPD